MDQISAHSRVGLFLGSFNPIHVGHLIMAQTVLNRDICDAVVFVVSPHNPFKDLDNLASEHHRLSMVKLAIKTHPKLMASDVEFHLPKPSYTIDTLHKLTAAHPTVDFTLLLGSDNMVNFHLWKNHMSILANHKVCTYLRPGFTDFALKTHAQVEIMTDAPLLEISATFIRSCLQENKSIRFLTPITVIEYIQHNALYRFDVE